MVKAFNSSFIGIYSCRHWDRNYAVRTRKFCKFGGGAFQVQEIIPEKKTEKTDRPEAAEIKGAVQTKSSEKTTEKIREG